jgi:tetratricopeptide (TPR) repeat protein
MRNSGPHHEIDHWLTKLRAEPDTPVGPCPDDEVLMRIAAAARLGEAAGPALDHVVNCQACAEQLKSYLAIFAEPNTELADLHAVSRKPKFLQNGTKFSDDNSRSPGTQNPIRVAGWLKGWRWVTLPGLVAIVLLALIPQLSLQRAKTLVARSEHSSRGSRFRLTDQGWAPPPERRSELSSMRSDEELGSAREWLFFVPRSAAALTVRGRMAMDQSDTTAAIAFFEQAKALRPKDPGMLNDYGAALAAKAMADRDSAAAIQALALFQEAVRLNSQFAPALFNESLLFDNLGQKAAACSAMQIFLRIENDPQWKTEAHARLRC